ncbi:hypothetical protein TA3x_002000 [Tundrisphaera sp. TA3]|uniref:hypothetical protein n=1 Tax=Tundrisphaera sp. TA3 TaxID=3435775 RepID=UPI003EB6C2CF
MTSGPLSILNIALGQVEFRADSGDPVEVEKARRPIEDMLRRGNAILVDDGDGLLRGATGFDAARDVYKPDLEECRAPLRRVAIHVPTYRGIPGGFRWARAMRASDRISSDLMRTQADSPLMRSPAPVSAGAGLRISLAIGANRG